MDLANFQIPELTVDQNVEIETEKEGLISIKNLLNILIRFINKIIAMEF